MMASLGLRAQIRALCSYSACCLPLCQASPIPMLALPVGLVGGECCVVGAFCIWPYTACACCPNGDHFEWAWNCGGSRRCNYEPPRPPPPPSPPPPPGVVDGWTRHASSACASSSRGSHNGAGTTWSDATAACSSDANCGALWDYLCDGSGFSKCDNGYAPLVSGNGCVWVQPDSPPPPKPPPPPPLQVDGWMKYANSQCSSMGPHNGAGGTWSDATSYCLNNACDGLWDYKCDGSGYTVCNQGSTITSPSSGCLWVKPGSPLPPPSPPPPSPPPAPPPPSPPPTRPPPSPPPSPPPPSPPPSSPPSLPPSPPPPSPPPSAPPSAPPSPPAPPQFVYLIGGIITGGSATNTVEYLDLNSGVVGRGPNMIESRWDVGCVAIDGNTAVATAGYTQALSA